MHRESPTPEVHRRAFIGTVGSVATVGLAGCGDGKEGTKDSSPRSTPEAVSSPTAVRGVDRYDTTVVLLAFYSQPEFQFQRYGNINPSDLNAILSFDLANRSFGDNTVYGELIADWSSDPGTLEITLHDDFSYWDGEPVDATNVRLHFELEGYISERFDTEAHPSIQGIEQTGEYSLKFKLAEDWREEYALYRSVTGWTPKGSTAYYQPWLEQFEDATNDTAITDIIRDLTNKDEQDPDPFYNAPFRIENVHEFTITCDLRLEDEPVPHYVDDINFTTLEIKLSQGVTSEQYKRPFRQQWRPNAWVDRIENADISFATKNVALSRPFEAWSILFNYSQPPTSNVGLRRAIAYTMNRASAMRRRNTVPNKRQTPFERRREEAFVSDEILASLEDYGWDESRAEAATGEMTRVGFERDTDGRWLHQPVPTLANRSN